MNRQEKWDRRFLELAEFVSTWSKDPSTQVGAVIVKNTNEIVSLGYNGFPKGDLDLPEEYADRSIKYPKIIHAEMNAIKFAEQTLNWWDYLKSYLGRYELMRGYTVYTYPFMPCYKCAQEIASRGFYRVVSYKNNNVRWQDSFKVAKDIFIRYRINLELYDKV